MADEIKTGGGAAIQGDARPGNDFIGRDQIQINAAGAEALAEILRRLATLEAADDDIKRDIGRLQEASQDRADKQNAVSFQISRLEDSLDWRFKLIEENNVRTNNQLNDQKHRQDNSPTWLQIFMLVVAIILVVLMIIIILALYKPPMPPAGEVALLLSDQQARWWAQRTAWLVRLSWWPV